MPLDPRRVKELFQAALDLPDPGDRPAFLDQNCGGDRELRHRLEELLAAYDRPASALERPVAVDRELAASTDDATAGSVPPLAGENAMEAGSDYGPTAAFRPEQEAPLIGALIAGRYKLRQEIGEGGMGSVYLAEQTKPVKRQVALKLIKPGMDSRTVLARFESERQALALMDHPNIAKVLDAGTTEGGRPFFVMELVRGIPLTDYCDQHRLGLPERLALFRQICSAVQHAHQKGIIHRDLKPSNILVESHDGRPVPKVIDFGLAKATSGLQLSEHSLFTVFGSVTGTPLYMAPEQASFNALDVDTRADIYALGVILYELLTGSTPIRRETVRQAAIDEVLRLIREVEPATPSSRISTSDALPSIAATRQVEPSRLCRLVRGDLDWIVMKALAKERQRRYESAIALADDIERLTNHEPVSAGPPTAAYRFRKFVRRNRAHVIAASLVLLVMVMGIVGTTLALLEARRQERGATLQRQQAEKRLAQIEKSNEILGSIFRDLNPFSAEKAGKPLSALLGERLDQAAAQIESETIGDPLTVARMQMTLGKSQLNLGYPGKAVDLFTKAHATITTQFGPDHIYTLWSMYVLGEGYRAADRLDRALPLLEETLELMKAKLAAYHPTTLNCMHSLARCYQVAGKLDRALPLFEETLGLMKSRFGPDHPSTLVIMNDLAVAYQDAGKLDRALPLLEQTLELNKAKLGPDHPETLTSMNNLAIAYRNTGKLDRAMPLFEQTLAHRKVKLGPDHPHTLVSMAGLAAGYQAAGKLDRAVSLLEETLRLMKAKRGPDHRDTLKVMHNLAECYREAGKLDRAESLLEETLGLMKAKLGPDHPDTLGVMLGLAECYREAGKLDRAVPLLEQTFELTKAKLGPDHPQTLMCMNGLALGYLAAGKLDRSVPLLEQALELGKAKLGPDHPGILILMRNLASVYEGAGRPDRAEPLLRGLVEFRRRQDGSDSPQYSGALGSLGFNLLLQQKSADAERIVREALTIRESKEPDSWLTFNARSMLGGALLGQKRYVDAEPLLRAGYDGMSQRADKVPRNSKIRLVEALERLIELAEATDKPDNARRWKDEKAKLPGASVGKPEPEKK